MTLGPQAKMIIHFLVAQLKCLGTPTIHIGKTLSSERFELLENSGLTCDIMVQSIFFYFGEKNAAKINSESADL